MMSIQKSVIVVFALIIHAFGYQWYMDNHPTFITASNINQLLTDESSIKIVKYFTPWCRYCRYMKKIIDNFHQKVVEDGRKDIKFYEVNCQQQRQICQYFSISSYPNIYIFDKNGKIFSKLGGYYPQEETDSILIDIIKQIDQQNHRKNQMTNQVEEQKQPINKLQNQNAQVKNQNNNQNADIAQKTLVTQQIKAQKLQKKQKSAPKQNLQKQFRNTNSQLKLPNIPSNKQPENQQYRLQIKQTINKSPQPIKNTLNQKTDQKFQNQSFTETAFRKIINMMIYLLIGALAGYYFKDIFSKTNKLGYKNPQQSQYKYCDQKQPDNQL